MKFPSTPGEMREDLERFVEERMKPVRQKMIEDERIQYTNDLDKWSKKQEEVEKGYPALISQVISLEVALFGATVVFGMTKQPSGWMVGALALFILSIGIGIWLQKTELDSSLYWQQYLYKQRMLQHWQTREFAKDETVKTEREILEKSLVQNFTIEPRNDRVLKILHLDVDKIQFGFYLFFFISLVLMLVQFVVGN